MGTPQFSSKIRSLQSPQPARAHAPTMILGPVSLVDCLVFVIFLAPQLILHVGLVRTVLVAGSCLPFLICKLPVELVKQRYLDRQKDAWTASSTFFEDLVIRCVRYAFANVPNSVGRIFFSKWVAMPFLRWRMLRHGFVRSPVCYKEYVSGKGRDQMRGIWVMHRPEQPPDLVLYYFHGGGFAMGSAYFYLEFLMVWHALLLEAGYKNPAIFALEYTLVPDDIYPRQIHEALSGYQHVLDYAKSASKVCVAGDSAGGCIVLSLLHELGNQKRTQKKRNASHGGLVGPQPPMLPMPRMATLISPWVTLMTHRHRESKVDFLDRTTLWKYAHEYAGESMINQYPASPGSCIDDALWLAACPEKGYHVMYGEEEVFAPDIEHFFQEQQRLGLEVRAQKIEAGIHAWPVASLFLSSTRERRLHGLRCMVNEIQRRMDRHGMMNGNKRSD